MSAATVARVLFDEAHSEAWTIRPDVAREMQPAHPADSSYAAAAAALSQRDFAVAANVAGPLDAQTLSGCDVLVIAHPSDPAWERTIGAGSPRLSTSELEAVEAFVERGGGLIVLGETEQDKYGNNVNDAARALRHPDRQRHCPGLRPQPRRPELGPAPSSARAPGGARATCSPASTPHACIGRPRSRSVNGSRVLARAQATSSAPGEPMIVAASARRWARRRARRLRSLRRRLHRPARPPRAVAEHRRLGRGRRVPAARAEQVRSRAARTSSPAWAQLRDETNALALLQSPDGSLTAAAAAGGHVDAMIEAIARQESRFPHQAEYLRAVRVDLRAWADGGFARPDFTRSLDAFRPERDRRDGVENLVRSPDVQAERIPRYLL